MAPSAKPAPETKPPAATQVAPDAAVITIRGLCDHPPADKTAASGCSTVFTRAQFEALVELIQPNLPPAQRRQLATNYANALILAEQARQMGLDKGPRFEELVKLQRLSLLRQLLSQALEEKASQIPDKDIADYYTANSSAYEEVELERLYVPRAQQLEAPKEKMTPEETQKRQQDAQAVMKKEAADLRARAAAGEDIAKLQEEAYKTAGFKIAPPPTKMEKHRRSSLPPAQVSVMELKSGEISPVIEDVNGYFIYKVGEKNMLPLDQVRAEISYYAAHATGTAVHAGGRAICDHHFERRILHGPAAIRRARNVFAARRASGDQDTLDGSQSLVQVGDDVRDVLDAHRDPHQAIGDANGPSSLFAQGGVRHGRGVGDQRFHSAERFSEKTHSHFLQHSFCMGEGTGFEGDHRPETAHLPPGQLVLRMLGQSRIEDLPHFLVALLRTRPQSCHCDRAAACAPPGSSLPAAPTSTRTATGSLRRLSAQNSVSPPARVACRSRHRPAHRCGH